MEDGGTKHTGVPVKTLKKLLKKAGLKVSGKKATLTRRAKKARLYGGEGLVDRARLYLSRKVLPTKGVLANLNYAPDVPNKYAAYNRTKDLREYTQPKFKVGNLISYKKAIFEGSPEQKAARAERGAKPAETHKTINDLTGDEGYLQKLKEAFKAEYGYDMIFDRDMLHDYIIHRSHKVWKDSPEQKAARAERLTNGVEFANDYFDLMKKGKVDEIQRSFSEKYGYYIYDINDDELIKDYIVHYYTVVVRDMDGGKKKRSRRS